MDDEVFNSLLPRLVALLTRSSLLEKIKHVGAMLEPAVLAHPASALSALLPVCVSALMQPASAGVRPHPEREGAWAVTNTKSPPCRHHSPSSFICHRHHRQVSTIPPHPASYHHHLSFLPPSVSPTISSQPLLYHHHRACPPSHITTISPTRSYLHHIGSHHYAATSRRILSPEHHHHLLHCLPASC